MSHPPSPDTRIATAPASGSKRQETDPGHGSRGAPFGRLCPAIRAPASYRVAALAGLSARIVSRWGTLSQRRGHRGGCHPWVKRTTSFGGSWLRSSVSLRIFGSTSRPWRSERVCRRGTTSLPCCGETRSTRGRRPTVEREAAPGPKRRRRLRGPSSFWTAFRADAARNSPHFLTAPLCR